MKARASSSGSFALGLSARRSERYERRSSAARDCGSSCGMGEAAVAGGKGERARWMRRTTRQHRL